MPLWVSDFLGDTLDLDANEIGAYMLLLMAQWNRDGGSLPDDAKKLQRVARCGRNWPKVWGNISRYFKTDESGIYSARLRLEAQNVATKREVNAHNGALGGAAKALKTNNAHLANATNSLQRNPSIPEPEPYKKEEPKGSLSSGDDVTVAFDDYNSTARDAGFPVARALTKARRASLKARLSEAGGIDGWRDALSKARASPHCTGHNDRGWTADLDFLLQQKSFTRLMEGSYDAKPNRTTLGTTKRQENGPDAALESIVRLAGLR